MSHGWSERIMAGLSARRVTEEAGKSLMTTVHKRKPCETPAPPRERVERRARDCITTWLGIRNGGRKQRVRNAPAAHGS